MPPARCRHRDSRNRNFDAPRGICVSLERRLGLRQRRRAGLARLCVDMISDTSPVSAAARRPLRVLIVEDETLTSLFLQGVLRELGYAISGIAPSLRTALAIAAGTPSQLAIVDVGLAGDGGDGIDTAAALWERHGVRSLLMTGATFAEFADRIQTARPLCSLSPSPKRRLRRR
jgi:two-component system, response regulator PdtaR